MRAVLTEFEIPGDVPIPPDRSTSLTPSAELVPFQPKPLSPSDLVGRRVETISPHVGTYGMGGPGFFGFDLGGEWLVISIWGAAEWMLADGRRVQDSFYAEEGSPSPWAATDWDALAERVAGARIAALRVERTSLELRLDNGTTFLISDDPATRPRRRGTGGPRAFDPEDDLREGVFLSPTAEIWV